MAFAAALIAAPGRLGKQSAAGTHRRAVILREKFDRNEKVMDTVLSGIYASIGLYRKPSAGEILRAHKLLESANLACREKDIIGHLSDGERQRVFMIRALINDPDILILDEPATGLDILAREEFLYWYQDMVSGFSGLRRDGNTGVTSSFPAR